jgi:hypothetical protein
MIDSFLEEINNRDLENDDSLSLIEMKEANNILSLTFKLQSDFDTKDDFQAWKVECEDFIQRRICDDYFCSFDIFKDHVLLWEYNQPKPDLYFKGSTENISGLIGELYLKHLGITQDWIPLTEYLNDMVDIHELIKGGYGLLASAPINIIKEFSEILNKFNIKPSIISNGIARYWDGLSWVNGPSPYSILIFGNCFVIAKQFKVERIQ